MIDHIQTHEGRPYDHGAYPHLGAPGGPCDAFDDDAVRTIWLQFASRLGKTFVGTAALLFTAANNPSPMMFASSTEQTAKDVIARVYATAERCRPLAGQLQPPRKRNQKRMEFAFCKIWTAWSRSVSTLADKGVKVGHANEIDKWEHLSTSREADPLKLFTDRFKEYPTRKIIFESTPAIKGSSRIEHGRLQTTNCGYFVPCPHCGRYQRLTMAQIHWDKPPGGKSDKELARRTGHYVCLHCKEKIFDHHRGRMMRRGVWVPEGCGIDDDRAAETAENWRERGEWQGWHRAPWITGRPLRDGVDAGYQLSSLYALSLGWGDLAAEFVASKDKPQDLRNFVNQWLGETWEIADRQQTWEKLGQQIASDVPRGIVPADAAFITCGVDKQDWGFVYTKNAWSPGRRTHTLDYGTCQSFAELREILLTRHRRDGDQHTLACALVLIDSGFRPKGVAEFVREMRKAGLPILPSKGSSKPLNVVYRTSRQSKDSAMPGETLVMVDTITTQDWIEAHISPASEPGIKKVFRASLAEHQDYLEQLLNDAPVDKLDSSNNARISWDRINTGIPNDYRDCDRLNIAAMMLVTRGGPIRPPNSAPPQPSRPRLRTPDGRPFLMTER